MTDLENAIAIVREFEDGTRNNNEGATEVFRALVNEDMSLSEMQSIYYGLLECMAAEGHDRRTISATGAVVRAAWDGIGDWRF